MYSNYNVLTIPIQLDGKYKIGDIFECSKNDNWRIMKFHGLQIKGIDYCWGVRLHFDWGEWKENDHLKVRHEIKGI